ncbi:glycosyltransferase family 4 protein [Sphingobium subterraneum]|uniref:Glycosyltransferase involved in cell wall biosynthesis n=1 Tax=Sphingobium subterraneum TaxID=627688 RepID=A0A841J333_9SPHN|nr:glycosyltransferase family 4 protein [Sphingobium subterraneum]MBB6124752.1 glycosyltransferase involved in cell wall biosynthesis [Sphingobium subterraneum]
MTLRIAYVINSLEGGGAALPVPSIVDVLRRAGAEVKVFALTARDERARAALVAAEIDVAVRAGGEDDHFAALRWLDQSVRAWGATHLWTSLTRATLLGQLVGLRRRLPVISWQHNAFLKPANLWLLRTTRDLSKLWVGDSDEVTRLTAERLGVNPERVLRWPIFRADPTAPVASSWTPGETIRIGTLGRLHPAKGYDLLVDALAQLPPGLPPFEIVIGGEGAQRAALLAQMEARGVRTVRLAGYVEDPKAFLAGLHLYLQPSRREGLCIAAHEAMQAGLPVVAAAVGQLPFSIQHGITGHLFPPGDIAALSATLEQVLSEPEALAARGMAARYHILDEFGPAPFEAAGLAILERLSAF